MGRGLERRKRPNSAIKMSRESISVLGEGEQVVGVNLQRHHGGMLMNHLKSGIRKAKSGTVFTAETQRRGGAFGEMGGEGLRIGDCGGLQIRNLETRYA